MKRDAVVKKRKSRKAVEKRKNEEERSRGQDLEVGGREMKKDENWGSRSGSSSKTLRREKRKGQERKGKLKTDD